MINEPYDQLYQQFFDVLELRRGCKLLCRHKQLFGYVKSKNLTMLDL